MNSNIEQYIKFKETFKIGSFDCDLNGKAKLTSICNYLQEIAGNHVDTIHQGVDDLKANNLTWVLSRLKVQMTKYPKFKEQIEIETWSIGTDGLFGNREFQIYDSKGYTIGIVSSSWLVINIHTKRPTRPQQIVSQMPVNNEVHLFESGLEKIKLSSELDSEESIQIHYSDIDINHHVNNVKYIKWVVDSCPIEFLTTHEIHELEINFLHEAKLNDKIKSFNSTNKNKSEIVVKNEINNTEHCRAIINWK